MRQLFLSLPLLLVVSGCRVTGMGFAMSSDSMTPAFGLNLAPRQTEPDIEFEKREGAVTASTSAAKERRGNLLTRWRKEEPAEELPERIPLPRRESLEDEEGDSAEDDEDAAMNADYSGDAFEF